MEKRKFYTALGDFEPTDMPKLFIPGGDLETCREIARHQNLSLIFIEQKDKIEVWGSPVSIHNYKLLLNQKQIQYDNDKI